MTVSAAVSDDVSVIALQLAVKSVPLVLPMVGDSKIPDHHSIWLINLYQFLFFLQFYFNLPDGPDCPDGFVQGYRLLPAHHNIR